LQCICAQRLLRRLCACKQFKPPSADELSFLERAKDGLPIKNIFQPLGCDACGQTGYKGRIGIHELLPLTGTLRELVNHGATATQFKETARREGMRTLFEDAMEKVKTGISSTAEALATVKQDEE